MNVRVYTLEVHLEVPFQISRAVRTEKRVVLVELTEGARIARGQLDVRFIRNQPNDFTSDLGKLIHLNMR